MSESRIQIVSLNEINGGSVIERFAEDMDLVIRNIRDVNTDPTKVRRITHVFSFKPNHSRSQCSFEFDSKLTLARPVPSSTLLYVGIDRSGAVVATEYNHNQPNLPMYEQDVQRASGLREGETMTVDAQGVVDMGKLRKIGSTGGQS